MDKFLRGRSKSRERTDKSESEIKQEDISIGATAFEIKPIEKEPAVEINMKDKSEIDLSPFQKLTSKSDIENMTPSPNLKTERLDDRVFDHLSKEAQELPDELYYQLITHSDGSPLYYFGATNFTKATKAIFVKGDTIYSVDPKRIKPPDDTEQHTYEDPYQTRNVTGTKPKQTAQNINLMTQDINKDLMTQNINKEISLINEKLNEMTNLIQQSRESSRKNSRRQSLQSPVRKHEIEHEEDNNYDINQYNTNYETLEQRFCKFLLKQSKIINYITPLNHDQGSSYALWLHGLKLEMETFAIPQEFTVPIAIRKLPDNIRSDIVSKKITTMAGLDAALYSIYCGTKNAISLKTQFFKDNKLAPHDRNYNALRDKIKRTQVPMIISVERIGQKDIPAIRERLVEETSERIATELFLNAIQEDAKRSVLNKGRHETFDELVQRANDFASSIPEELKTKIGNITEKPFYNDQSQKCKVHPMGNHSQTECRLKCKLHPWSSHTDAVCFQKQNKMQNQENTRTCPKERYGKHGEPFWCLFCNTVTPKFQRHQCFHCWKCSKENNAILSRHCPCDKTYKKPQ